MQQILNHNLNLIFTIYIFYYYCVKLKHTINKLIYYFILNKLHVKPLFLNLVKEKKIHAKHAIACKNTLFEIIKHVCVLP